MALLDLIQTTCDRIGLTRPSAVVGSSDLQIRQLLALANEEGVSLMQRCDWQALTAEEQTNTPVPTDLDRFIPNSFFNRDMSRQLIGPLTPQQWQALKARPALSRVYLAFRQRDNTFLINPVPTAGETIAYEYRSLNWAMSSAGVGKSAFTSDDDTTALSQELMMQGLRWRWKSAKGLPYGEELETYERNVQEAIGNDGGATSLDQGGVGGLYPDRLVNIPEGGFGL